MCISIYSVKGLAPSSKSFSLLVLPGFSEQVFEVTGLFLFLHTLSGSFDVSGNGYEEVWRAVPCCAVNLTDCFWRPGKHVAYKFPMTVYLDALVLNCFEDGASFFAPRSGS